MSIPPTNPEACEASLQRLILARVNQLPGVLVWRMNTGVAQSHDGRVTRFGKPGQADLTGIMPGGRRLEIEIKRRGGRPSADQLAYAEMITSRGGLYLLAHTLEDAMRPLIEAIG